jgi:hypothetical protein
MRNIIMIAALLAILPGLASAEMKMQKDAPSAEAAAAPAETAVQDSASSVEAAPKQAVKHASPKKFVSTNAIAIEEQHSGKYAVPAKAE